MCKIICICYKKNSNKFEVYLHPKVIYLIQFLVQTAYDTLLHWNHIDLLVYDLKQIKNDSTLLSIENWNRIAYSQFGTISWYDRQPVFLWFAMTIMTIRNEIRIAFKYQICRLWTIKYLKWKINNYSTIKKCGFYHTNELCFIGTFQTNDRSVKGH